MPYFITDAYDYFDPLNEKPNFNNAMYVVDGGFLLHRVVWSVGQTYGEICIQYVSYIQKYYGENCTAVFDGYPDDNEKGTKAAECMRRFKKCSAPEILLNKDLKAAAQSKFLSNDKNKKRFICMLHEYLQDSANLFQEAPEDADALIVHTAIHYSSNYESVVTVGEDVDLLVILSQFAQ